MKRYYDYDKLRESCVDAVNRVAQEAGLEASHPLVTFAALDAIASSLKLLKITGSPLSRLPGRLGTDAYLASILARKVEELKSPHSLTVNGVMDEIVAALAVGKQPEVDHREALASATEYLIEGGVIERMEDGSLALVDSAWFPLANNGD